MNSFLSLMHVGKKYGKQKVLSDILLRFPSKGFIGIAGPSGCGKSTLLRLIAGLDPDYQGDIIVDGRSLKKEREKEQSLFRLRNFGFVYQKDSLLEVETALENVMLPRRALSNEPLSETKVKAKSLLFLVGLDGQENQKISSMSGGERQRVALARALICDPSILLCDEPTAALDEENAKRVFLLLKRISATKLVLVVSHDTPLLSEFSDRLITFLDGRVEKDEKRMQKPMKPLSLPRIEKQKKEPGLPLSFKIQHVRRRKKSKRIRTFLSEGAMTMGLVGFGLSIYASTSLSGQMQDVFSTFLPGNTVVMTPKNDADSGVSNLSICSFEDANDMALEEGEEIRGVGKTFVYDFEQGFPDDNDFVYSLGSHLQMLPGLSARSINDFLWLEEENVMPSFPSSMDWSDLILGLPYAEMAAICADFGLARGYSFLGNFIESGCFLLTLQLSNLAYGFSEETPFQVVGVVESEKTCLYHRDPLWNSRVFVDHYRFEDVGCDIPVNPQQVQSIPYYELKEPWATWYEKKRKEPEWDSYFFDTATSSYLPSLLSDEDPPISSRLYLYQGRRVGPSLVDLEKTCSALGDIRGYLPIATNVYWADSSSNFMGFSGRFFLCNSEELANELSEEYCELPLEASMLLGELPSGVKEGSVLSAASSGLRLSSDISNWKGASLSSPKEVLLSSSLFASFGNPERVYAAVETSGEERGGYYCRDFSLCALDVVGTIESETDTLYVNSNWTSDFFLECCGKSPLLLEPTGVVFEYRDGADPKQLLEEIGGYFPHFDIGCPNESVKESLEESTGYLQVVLSLFSLISLTVSGLLFLLVISLSVAEGAKEANLFFALGIPKAQIGGIYQVLAFLYSGSGLFAAIIGIIGAEIMVSFYLCSQFGTSLIIRISFLPMLLMAGVSLTLAGIVGGISRVWVRKKIEKKA